MTHGFSHGITCVFGTHDSVNCTSNTRCTNTNLELETAFTSVPYILRVFYALRRLPYSYLSLFNAHAYVTSHLVTSETHALPQPAFMFTQPREP